MDSNRRHELETNDLKEFLDNFKDFWDKHGNKVLIVLIVALLVYAGPKYYADWQKGKADEASEEMNAATSPDALLGVADDHEIVGDEATRRAADLHFGEARDAALINDIEAAEKSLKRAQAAYNTIAQNGQTVLYQLNGYEGLAKCALGLGEIEQSKAHYEKLIELAGETYGLFAARAEKAIENMPAVSNPVAFSPPKPVTIDPATSGPGSGTGFDPILPGLNLPDVTNPVTPVAPIVPPAGDPPAEDPAPAE